MAPENRKGAVGQGGGGGQEKGMPSRIVLFGPGNYLNSLTY